MVEQSTRAFIESLDLDEIGRARADIAITLATKLDQAADPKAPVGVAAATAGIASELRDTLAELEMSQGEAEAFLGQLFELPKAV